MLWASMLSAALYQPALFLGFAVHVEEPRATGQFNLLIAGGVVAVALDSDDTVLAHFRPSIL